MIWSGTYETLRFPSYRISTLIMELEHCITTLTSRSTRESDLYSTPSDRVLSSPSSRLRRPPPQILPTPTCSFHWSTQTNRLNYGFLPVCNRTLRLKIWKISGLSATSTCSDRKLSAISAPRLTTDIRPRRHQLPVLRRHCIPRHFSPESWFWLMTTHPSLPFGGVVARLTVRETHRGHGSYHRSCKAAGANIWRPLRAIPTAQCAEEAPL